MRPCMHPCSMHVRLSEKHGLGEKLLQKSWGILIQHGTRNKCKPEQIVNYSWSKSLELINLQPKKFSNVAYYKKSFLRNYDLISN